MRTDRWGAARPAGSLCSVVSPTPSEVVLARLSADVRRSVLELREALRALLGDRLADLRLFGSQARGQAHDESDIDVLVLVHQLDWDTWGAVVDLAHSITGLLSPAVRDFDRHHAPVSRASGFYKELRQESVKLL